MSGWNKWGKHSKRNESTTTGGRYGEITIAVNETVFETYIWKKECYETDERKRRL